MRELTRVMLRHDFGLLEWDAPLDRLCPPVANRLNYICWLSDLMNLSASSGSRPSPAAPSSAGGAVPSSGGGGGEDRVAEEPVMSAAQRNLLLFGTAGGVGVAGDGMAVCDDAGVAAATAAEAAVVGPDSGCCRGVDIGTGASCIYPLLGARVAGWWFLATEIDGVSADWAEKNVRSNGLQVRSGQRGYVGT